MNKLNRSERVLRLLDNTYDRVMKQVESAK